jgi:hypothetical protein
MRRAGNRSIELTDAGRAGLASEFGVDLAGGRAA